MILAVVVGAGLGAVLLGTVRDRTGEAPTAEVSNASAETIAVADDDAETLPSDELDDSGATVDTEPAAAAAPTEPAVGQAPRFVGPNRDSFGRATVFSLADAGKTSPRASADASKNDAATAASSAPASSAPADSSSAPDEGESKAPPFDKSAASSAVSGAAGTAAGCRSGEDAGGFDAQVAITFAPSGRATRAVVSGRYAGTPTGACIARTMKSASVPPFSGEAVTVTKTVAIP